MINYQITKGTVTDKTVGCDRQLLEFVVDTNTFNLDTWEDVKFTKIQRIDDTITVELKENKDVISRDFGLILINPCDASDVTYIQITQMGVEYLIYPISTVEEDRDIYTFVRGSDNDNKERIEIESYSDEGEKLNRVYVNGNVLTETEYRTIQLTVEGGSKKIFIAGVNKYKRVEQDNTDPTEVRETFIQMNFDHGIHAKVENSNNGDCKVIIESNGRPYSDNDEYFYVVRVAHYDNPRYYCEIKVDFKDKSTDTVTPSTSQLDFKYNGDIETGSTDTVLFDTGLSEDCDWEITEIVDDSGVIDPKWLSVTSYPLSFVAECKTNYGDPRSATITIEFNGTPMVFTVNQSKFNDYNVDPTAMTITLYADDLKSTVTFVVVSAGSPFANIDEGDTLPSVGADVVLRCTGHFVSGLMHTYMFAVWANIPNTDVADNETKFILNCTDGGQTCTITVIQKGVNQTLEPVTAAVVNGSGTKGAPAQVELILNPTDSMAIAYSSARWCQVTVNDSGSGNVISYIEIIDPNVYGDKRECRIIFTNVNDPSKTVSCLVTNTDSNEGYDCTVVIESPAAP